MSWIKENTLTVFQALIAKILCTGPIPKHIALIMDGNRRFADKKGVKKLQGHVKGFDKMSETLQWCGVLGVKELTVYAFSIENFKRKKEEVDAIMELARQKFEQLLEEKKKLMEHGICVRVIGNISMIPENIRTLIAEAMVMTKNNSKAYLNVAFAYTSKDEITQAVRDIVGGVKNECIHPDEIDEHLISKCLYTHNSPDPELLIRTSGEVRLSDFLMWQISHSCVYFANVLWPEFSPWHLFSAIFYYQRCYPGLRRKFELKEEHEEHEEDEPDKENEADARQAKSKTNMYIENLHKERLDSLEKMCTPLIPW